MSYDFDKMIESDNDEELLDMIDDIAYLKVSGQFLMKDIGVTSRVFFHWAEKGLVPYKSKVSEYKHEFRFIDLIWYNIVNELRDFGFPLEKIEIVKKILMEEVLFLEALNNPVRKHPIINKDFLGIKYDSKIELIERIDKETFGNKTNPDNFKADMFVIPLHIIIGCFLFDRTDIRLLIDSKGNVFPCSQMDLLKQNLPDLMYEAGFDSESYISISILKFISKFIMKEQNINFVRTNKILNENELQILSLIREGRAIAITIRFENQKPTFIEVTKKKKLFAESRLSEVIIKKSYQDILIKTQDGNIVFSNVTTKNKLK